MPPPRRPASGCSALMPRELPLVRPADFVAPPPIFERIGIVGLGLIGGSIALRARRLWPRSLVIGVDCNEVLEKAMVLHAIDVAADDLSIIGGAELVILAAPVAAIIERLGELAELLPTQGVITDVGSTKRAILEAARALPDRVVFIGGHPMAGSARRGIEHARADLFEGRPWLLVPPDGTGTGGSTAAAALEKLEQFVRALGAEPDVIGADEHDRVMAALSHLPQLAASALMTIVGELAGERLRLAGDGLRDTTRLAASSIDVWRDICAANRDFLADALRGYAAALAHASEALADEAALADLFQRANELRKQIE